MGICVHSTKFLEIELLWRLLFGAHLPGSNLCCLMAAQATFLADKTA